MNVEVESRPFFAKNVQKIPNVVKLAMKEKHT